MWWFMPIIPATRKADIKGLPLVQGWPGPHNKTLSLRNKRWARVNHKHLVKYQPNQHHLTCQKKKS